MTPRPLGSQGIPLWSHEGIQNQQVVTNGCSEEVAKPPKPKSDEEMKRELVEALEATGGNKSTAAKLVGIHRSTLYRRLERIDGVAPSEGRGIALVLKIRCSNDLRDQSLDEGQLNLTVGTAIAYGMDRPEPKPVMGIG